MHGLKIFKNSNLEEASKELSEWINIKKIQLISHNIFKDADNYIISIIYKY